MHRIDGPGATVDNKFTDGDPASAVEATTVTDDWLNAIQEEIAGVVESAGIVLSKATNGQLLAAITSKISAAIPANVPQGVRGAFSKLRLSATGANALVSVTADELTLSTPAAVYRTLQDISISINSAATGVNGLDSGTLAASTWYAVWVIWNGTTAAGLLSLSDTAPTLPAGYTHKARVGWIRTDGTANKYPIGFVQSGRNVQLLTLRDMATGTLSQWTAISVSSFVPVTAVSVTGRAQNNNLICAVAPNSNYDTYGVSYVYLPAGNGTAAQQFKVQLESTNIYGYSTSSGSKISALGWEDNL